MLEVASALHRPLLVHPRITSCSSRPSLLCGVLAYNTIDWAPRVAPTSVGGDTHGEAVVLLRQKHINSASKSKKRITFTLWTLQTCPKQAIEASGRAQIVLLLYACCCSRVPQSCSHVLALSLLASTPGLWGLGGIVSKTLLVHCINTSLAQ